MGVLLEAALRLLRGQGQDLREVEHTFIETVTFASSEEIVDMLHQVLTEDWIGFPVWARNLSYRLACLQRPDDAALRREAAADLRSFGPDWDDLAT
jgi:hypothetical protein